MWGSRTDNARSQDPRTIVNTRVSCLRWTAGLAFIPHSGTHAICSKQNFNKRGAGIPVLFYTKAALRSKGRRPRPSLKLITIERKCRLISKARLSPAIPGAVQCFHSRLITATQRTASSRVIKARQPDFFPLLKKKKYDLLYFFLKFSFGCAGSLLLRGLFSSYSLVVVCGLHITVASLVEHGLGMCKAFSGCCSWAQQLGLPGSRAQAQ